MHNCHNKHQDAQSKHIRIQYVAAMISWYIQSNHLHLKQIESIHVNHAAQVPLHAIWLQHPRQLVYCPLECSYIDNKSGSDAKTRLKNVASIVQG